VSGTSHPPPPPCHARSWLHAHPPSSRVSHLPPSVATEDIKAALCHKLGVIYGLVRCDRCGQGLGMHHPVLSRREPLCASRLVALYLIASPGPHLPPARLPPCSILFITPCLGFAFRAIPLVPSEFAAGLTLVRAPGSPQGRCRLAPAAVPPAVGPSGGGGISHVGPCGRSLALAMPPPPSVLTFLPFLPAVCCRAHHAWHWGVSSEDLQGQ
jgi:hypothetical protein